MSKFFRRRKFCKFTAEGVTEIDYKDLNTLRQYLTETGKIYESAADEERGPAGIGQRAEVAERGGQVQAGEDQQGGDQRHHEGALRSGVHQARFRRLSPAFYRSRPVGGRRAGAIMSA